jgi:hypothetical protein
MRMRVGERTEGIELCGWTRDVLQPKGSDPVPFAKTVHAITEASCGEQGVVIRESLQDFEID